MDEFSLIATYLAPLCADEGSIETYQLKSDAAVLSPSAGSQLVFSKDMMVESVHYFKNEDPTALAQKLLRVNLSDIAATGAKPIGYLLGLSLSSADEAWIKAFAAGLKMDQESFQVSLLGGDTVKLPEGSAQVLSLTIVGEIANGVKPLSRMGAKVGDKICVTGFVGDASIGLQQRLDNDSSDTVFMRRFQLPEPRLEIGAALLGHASSCADTSDGFLVDLQHILENADCGAEIYLQQCPVRPELEEVKRLTRLDDLTFYNNVLSGGEDYELVFTIEEQALQSFLDANPEFCDMIHEVGKVIEGNEIVCFDADEHALPLQVKGWNHFTA